MLFFLNQKRATVQTHPCVLWKWASRVMTGGKSSTKERHISISCRNKLMVRVASGNHCSWQSLLWMIQVVISSFKWVSFSAPRQTRRTSEFRLSGTNSVSQWMRPLNRLGFFYGFCLISRHREVCATKASPNTSVPTASRPVTWWVAVLL